MEAMNAIGFAPHGFQPASRPSRMRRVDTVTLASTLSILALLIATVLHVVFGVGEAPLVIGTILLASIAGWINASLPQRASAPTDGGHEDVADLDELELFDQAA